MAHTEAKKLVTNTHQCFHGFILIIVSTTKSSTTILQKSCVIFIATLTLSFVWFSFPAAVFKGLVTIFKSNLWQHNCKESYIETLNKKKYYIRLQKIILPPFATIQ